MNWMSSLVKETPESAPAPFLPGNVTDRSQQSAVWKRGLNIAQSFSLTAIANLLPDPPGSLKCLVAPYFSL